MNKEMLMIIAMGLGGILFALGGTSLKWVRRFVLPIILGILAIVGSNVWYLSLAMTICLMVALSLPYGQNTNYWMKALTFIAIFVSTLWLGFSWWIIISPVLVLVMFFLSNWKLTANIVFWKAWEFLTGVYLGITVASLMWR